MHESWRCSRCFHRKVNRETSQGLTQAKLQSVGLPHLFPLNVVVVVVVVVVVAACVDSVDGDF